MANVVLAGGFYTLLIDENCNLHSVGWNGGGRCGRERAEDCYTSEKIISQNVVSLSPTGLGHSMVIHCDGSVSACGINNAGQLGLGHYDNQSRLSKINFEDCIISVAAGFDHTLFLDEKHKVYSCGNNRQGQLGYAGENRTKPKQILNLPDIKAIVVNDSESFFLDFEGNVWATPLLNQQFLRLHSLPPISSIYGFGNKLYAIDDSGVVWERTKYSPATQLPLSNVHNISVGYDVTFFLKNNGELYGSGTNEGGGLGAPVRGNLPQKIDLPPISFVSANYFHSVLVDTDGCLWSCGSNLYGETLHPLAERINTFRKCSLSFQVAPVPKIGYNTKSARKYFNL